MVVATDENVLKATLILSSTLKSLQMGMRRVIHQGGQYSGKTVGVLGALAIMSNDEDESSITTVTSMSLPHLKGGALRDFESYVYPQFKHAIRKYHKTDHLFTFKSGALMEFKAFENEMTARGPKRKRLFINEANKFEEMLFFQLDSRSEQTIVDYNPSIKFWAHRDLIGQPGNATFISDHRHNPFLTAAKHAEIEGICTFMYGADGRIVLKDDGEPVVLKGSYELWKVYARGLTGNVLGVIFPNWEMIDDSIFPRDEDWIYGIDFGYTNDPTAIVKICLIGNTLFVKELAYEPGLSGRQIIGLLKSNGFDLDNSVIYCEHDPDMVRDLRKWGIANALPARKGQGSINAGIVLLQKYDVKYSNKSQNLHRERSLYVWETEKDTGRLTNIPVDNNNHTFDAIRYAAYTRYLKQ